MAEFGKPWLPIVPSRAEFAGGSRRRLPVRWPPRFDAYLGRPAIWTEAGVDLTLPPGFTGKAADLKGTSDQPIVAVRAIAELPREAVESMISAYRDGTVSVPEVARLHGVTVGSLYRVLRKHEVTFRSGPSRNRSRALRPRKTVLADRL